MSHIVFRCTTTFNKEPSGFSISIAHTYNSKPRNRLELKEIMAHFRTLGYNTYEYARQAYNQCREGWQRYKLDLQALIVEALNAIKVLSIQCWNYWCQCQALQAVDCRESSVASRQQVLNHFQFVEYWYQGSRSYIISGLWNTGEYYRVVNDLHWSSTQLLLIVCHRSDAIIYGFVYGDNKHSI